MKTIIIAALCALTLAACGPQGSKEHDAQALLEEARAAMDAGEYAKTINTIERLRHDHPKAVKERREGLELYKQASLKLAEQQLAQTDSLLEAAKERYNSLQYELLHHQWTKANLSYKQHELTRARLRMDSLQVEFDTQCAKIKLIHRKSKQ
ncbi:MAG: hypothetical protein IJ527_05660 [Prevotella sp.]|nr:hypothetical protein [Prevotella sp.]